MAFTPSQQTSTPTLDALAPADMAAKAEAVGIKKATSSASQLFALALLAGAFIALGAIYYTIAVSDAGSLPYGVQRILGGVAFCLGLVLVIVGGAELFTGNSLMVMAWASRKITAGQLLRSWAIVYLGNFVGSVLTALIVFLGAQYRSADGAVGLAALSIANSKCDLAFIPALAQGIMCNVMVCMAVWLCFSARTTTDKIAAILFPISAFVAAGFEHSVANMYFIPMGLFIKQLDPNVYQLKAFLEAGKTAADYTALTWGNLFLRNLIPVTLGNIIGGALVVGGIYWFIYLRKK